MAFVRSFRRLCRREYFEGTRYIFPIVAAWLVKKVFAEELWLRIPTVISGMIVSYLTDAHIPSRIVVVGSQTFNKVKTLSANEIIHLTPVPVRDYIGGDRVGRSFTLDARIIELLRELMHERLYGTVENIGSKMGRCKFASYVYPLITTFEDFKGLCTCLQQKNLLEDFLEHANEDILEGMILEVNKGGDSYFPPQVIPSALSSAFERGDLDGVIFLLRVTEQCDKVEKERTEGAVSFFKFAEIIEQMFEKLSFEKHGTIIKHFLSLYGEEFEKKHPTIYRVFCEELGRKTGKSFGMPSGREFLTDLARQPIYLSLSDFVRKIDSIKYYEEYAIIRVVSSNWRECIGAFLFDDEESGKSRWSVLRGQCPDMYPGDYPSSSTEREKFLERFKPKRVWMEKWEQENVRVKL